MIRLMEIESSKARDKCSAQLVATQSREVFAELPLRDEAEVVLAS